MDIYSFINSRDVAAHCREINKVWTPFEMAVIIGRSKRPIAEKHAAWRELIANCPDMPTPANMHFKSYESLHKKLAEKIDYEESVLALFKKPESGAVYRYRVLWNDDCRHSHSVFSSLEKALTDIRDSWERDEAHEIIIEKVFADNEGEIEVYVDYDGAPYSVSAQISAESFPDIVAPDKYDGLMFDDLFYVDIPIPFKRGDILTIPAKRNEEDHIFVLDSLPHDNPEVYAKHLSGEFGDGTDMMEWGFFVYDNGLLYGDHTGYHDSFEYYRGKLEGKERILHYVSLFLKGEIRLPELLTMQCRIILEYQLDNDFPVDVHGCFIPENLLAENRLTQEENEVAEDV